LVFAAPPDVKEIISNSVHANHLDFVAAPHYNHKEKDDTGNGAKTFQITMIDGSPYKRLIAINGEPIPATQKATELQKEAAAKRNRASESRSARSARMAKYEQGRLRDSAMMSQLTVAFDFTFDGEDTLRGHSVYVLKAIPKPGYVPPNRDCEVLPGMRGRLWIDKASFQWVQVEAEVIQPVSIGGFLATVNPGTRFELDKEPVGDGSVWFPSHFKMQANAKVLYLFSKNSSEEDTFWDYQRAE
jgi:hypothetical protein